MPLLSGEILSAAFLPFSRRYLIGLLKALLGFTVFLSVLAGLVAGIIWLTVYLEYRLFEFYVKHLSSWVLIGKKSTGLIALGIAWFGGTSLYFFFSVFSRNEPFDVTGLIEINREDEPDLIDFINQTAKEAGVRKPVRVFLSPEEMLRVTFDSGFRSVFGLEERNVLVGLSYVNILTVSEFKAVLAQELGRYSQFWAPLHDINAVIDSQLSRDDWKKEMEASSGWSKLLSFFLWFSKKVVAICSWIVWILHRFLARQTQPFARELQFRADVIGANAGGGEALVEAIRKRQMASIAENAIQNCFEKLRQKGMVTTDLFDCRLRYVQWLAAHLRIALVDGIPRTSGEDNLRFGFGRVTWRSKWSGVAADAERIARLGRLTSKVAQFHTPAQELFVQRTVWQKAFTDWAYENRSPGETPSRIDVEAFVREAWRMSHPAVYMDVFGDFYENRLLKPFDLERTEAVPDTWEEAFSRDLPDSTARIRSIANDTTLLENARLQSAKNNIFIVDDVACSFTETEKFIGQLTGEKERLLMKQQEADRIIYFFCQRYFSKKEALALKDSYRFLFDLRARHDEFSSATDEFWQDGNPKLPGQAITDRRVFFERITDHIRTVWPLIEKDGDKDLLVEIKKAFAMQKTEDPGAFDAKVIWHICDLTAWVEAELEEYCYVAQKQLLGQQAAGISRITRATFPPPSASLSQNQHP